MKQRGFFLRALVLCVTTPALAQSARDLKADRLAAKLGVAVQSVLKVTVSLSFKINSL